MGKRDKDGRAPVKVNATTAAILAGEIDLSEWDDDEIMRGQRRGKDGRFHGRPPKLVAQEIHEERNKRFFEQGMLLLRHNVHKAVDYLLRVVQDESVSHADRIKAATFVIERVYGKAPERVSLEIGDPPWMKALQDGIVGIEGFGVISIDDEEEDIIDAEIIEEDPKPLPPTPRTKARARVKARRKS